MREQARFVISRRRFTDYQPLNFHSVHFANNYGAIIMRGYDNIFFFPPPLFPAFAVMNGCVSSDSHLIQRASLFPSRRVFARCSHLFGLKKWSVHQRFRSRLRRESSSLVIIFKRVLGRGINSLRSIARIINSLLIIKPTWMLARLWEI